MAGLVPAIHAARLRDPSSCTDHGSPFSFNAFDGNAGVLVDGRVERGHGAGEALGETEGDPRDP